MLTILIAYYMWRPILWILGLFVAYVVATFLLVVLWRFYKINFSRRWRIPIQSQDAILITGATSGIGLAVAKHLHSLGYSIFACYYDSREAGYAELSKLNKKSAKGQHLLLIEMDVRSEDSIKKAGETCRKLISENGLRLHAIINNAGLGSLQPFAWLQRKNIKALVETNLLGSMLVTREFLDLIVESKGRVINVSSGLSLVPGANYASYGATKCAQIYLTKSWNLEWLKAFQVKSIAVVPHNFIKNTNICSLNVKNNEQAWNELTPQEKKLYKNDFDEHCKLAKQLESATQKHMKDTSERQQVRPQSTNRFMAIACGFWAALRGQNEAKTLEESGALDGFEDAIRLRDPPELIFAGDFSFSLIVGSLLLLLPLSCATTLLSHSVSPSLYR